MDDRTDATLPDTRHQHTDPVPRVAASDLGERYAVGPLLGRGGMGEVRLARDLRIDREVAVKLMRSSQRDEHTLGRFFREARVQGVLEHPAVVPVHDLGIDGEGNPYFVMKRLAGITLADVITSKDPAVHDRWPRRTLLARLVDVCLAIEFAHTRGVIHRDVKPANIMIGDFGEAYILDWGLARIAEDTESFRGVAPLSGDNIEHTIAGDLLGTPGYMSPEQARGEPVDARTDVFALGCVLFEILVRVPALPRGLEAIPATLAATHHRPSSAEGAERAEEVPPELDDVCARATLADAKARPTARALADAIQAYLDGDRDVARRNDLAEVHAQTARAALAGSGDAARATAMREAGRALALDPANATAAAILSHLLLERPDAIPAEALASADLERGETRQKVTRWAGIAFFGLLPALGFLALVPVRHLWPVIAAAVMTAITGSVALVAARKPLPMGSRLYLGVLACNTLLLTTVGLLFGPLLLLPIFLVGSMAGWLPQPTTYRPWIIVVAHAVPLVVLFGLELVGVLPRSVQVEHGAVVLRAYAVDLTLGTTILIYVVALVAQTGHMMTVALSGRRAAEAAQDQQHAQSWHLRQLLPRERDDAAR